MKAFYTTDGYLLHYLDGVWTDGDNQFHDLNGNPLGFDGESLDGVHMNVIVRPTRPTLACCNHGVSIDYQVHAFYWHPVAFARNLHSAARCLVDYLDQHRCSHDVTPARYRLLSCNCDGVADIPETPAMAGC